MKPANVGCDPKQAKKIKPIGIDGDGNCLFNSVSFCMEDTVEKPDEIRRMVADHMLANPDRYNEEEFGKDPQKYLEWLTSGPEAWGGTPELKALSELYNIELALCIIEDGAIIVFGHG